MTASLDARRDDYGLVSLTTWRGTRRPGANTILIIAYFRSAQGLHRFAHDPAHRAGWDWYAGFVRRTGYRHFGLFHETFRSRPGDWETIYADCEPTLLGAGSVRVGGAAGDADGAPPADQDSEKGFGGGEGEGEKMWIRPLVSADHPALRTQAKRMALSDLTEET